MTQGRLWIVVGLVLLVAPGCGLQHVAEWLVVRSAEKSQKDQGPVAHRPAAPPIVRQKPFVQPPVSQPPALQPAQDATDLAVPVATPSSNASATTKVAGTPRADSTKPASRSAATPPAAT